MFEFSGLIKSFKTLIGASSRTCGRYLMYKPETVGQAGYRNLARQETRTDNLLERMPLGATKKALLIRRRRLLGAEEIQNCEGNAKNLCWRGGCRSKIRVSTEATPYQSQVTTPEVWSDMVAQRVRGWRSCWRMRSTK